MTRTALSTCMLLMVAFGTLAPSTDSYRTTVFGSSSVAGLASIGPSMRQLTLFCLQCEANSGIHTKRPIAKDGPEDHGECGMFTGVAAIANRPDRGHTEKQNKQGTGAVCAVCCCWKLCVKATSEATMR